MRIGWRFGKKHSLPGNFRVSTYNARAYYQNFCTGLSGGDVINLLPPQATLLLRRIRGSNLSELLKAAAPLSIDRLLYIGEKPVRRLHRLPARLSVRSFSVDELSGVERIDRKLTRYRLAYVVFSGHEIAHISWVCFDASLPSQYGFDFRLPVIDETVTQSLHRGKGLFPYTLNYILHDLRNRRIADSVYILVSPTNHASIRGIEKAGFRLLARLEGTRLLGVLIINKSIQRAPLDPWDTKILEPPIAG